MKIEVRSGGVHIEGYVNAVERDSKIINVPSIGRCVEQIRAGAFENALNTAPDVAILENHDFSRRLGSVSQGNLKLYEDNIGLRAIADITDTDISEKARHGQIKGWSFGFICNEQEIEERSGNVPRRIVKGLSLSEVSLIDGNYTPCYNGTLVEVRSEGNFVEYRSGIDEKVEYNSSSDSENLIYTQLYETDSTAADENVENQSGEEIDYSYYENMLRYLELSGGSYSYRKSGRYEKRYNHNHDDKGRFCSGSGSGGGSFLGTDSKFTGSIAKTFQKSIAISDESGIINTEEHAYYPETIAGVTRVEGEVSFETADRGKTNPMYSSFLPTDEYSKNCPESVLAFESRMRGYNVEAAGFNENNPYMMKIAYGTSVDLWVDTNTGKPPKYISYQGDVSQAGKWLDSIVGKGERYSLEYSNRSGTRHNIIALRKNDKIHLYDPQSNDIKSGIAEINNYFYNSKKSNIRIFRIDNLDINSTYANAVLKASGYSFEVNK